jgi:beta-lactam-binding protein with PASTA domain
MRLADSKVDPWPNILLEGVPERPSTTSCSNTSSDQRSAAKVTALPLTRCLTCAAIFVTCLVIMSRAPAAEPTVADFQRWLQEAKAAKAAADAKVAQANKQNLSIRAQRDKVNAEIKDLKGQMASADQAISAAQSQLNSAGGKNAEHLQEAITYEKSLQRKIESKLPGASLQDGNGLAAVYDKLNDKNFKDFKSRWIDDIKKEIEANESKHRQTLQKAGAAETSRAESIRLTDEELPKLEQEKADLQKKLDTAVETERNDIRWRMDELSKTTAEIKQADPNGKMEDAARRLHDAEDKKEELQTQLNVANEKLLKLTNYNERRVAAQEAATAADEVRNLEKRLAEAQAAAAAAAAKAQPKPAPVAKAKPQNSQASASSETKIDDTKPPAPPPSTTSDQVTVPDLSVFDNVSEMKAVLAHAGLVGAFNASGKPPSKDLEFKFSGQSPPADTKVQPGSTVTVSIYQKFEDSTATAESLADDVTVPNLSVFDNVSEMKAVLAHAGLVGSFNASGKPPSKDQEFKFSGQSPLADTKVKRGSTVTVSIYQAFDATSAADTIPDVTDMTQEAAQAKLEGAGFTVGGVTEGGKAPSEEKANRIKGTAPAAGEAIPANKTVTLIKWGSFKEKAAPSDGDLPPPGGRSSDLVGFWNGTATDLIGMTDLRGQHIAGKTQKAGGLQIIEKGGRIMSNLPTIALQEFSPPSDHDQVVDGNRITYDKKGVSNDGDAWGIHIVVQVVGDKLIGIDTWTNKNKVIKKERWELQRAQ